MSKSKAIPISPNEKARLASVLNYGILDTRYEKDLDELTSFAASIFNAPIVLITILDEKRQWFKSNYGLKIQETARSISFCQYTILKNEIFEIENALKDERFADNPLVTDDPNIRFYCGAPLINEEGYAMGSLAIIDRVPRKFSENEKHTLLLLTKQVLNFFELTMKKNELEKDKIMLESRVKERTIELENKVAELEVRDKELLSLNNELKLGNEKLKTTISDLDNFVYIASHDLKAPINNIEGLLDYIQRELKEAWDVTDLIQLIRKSIERFKGTLLSLTEVNQAQHREQIDEKLDIVEIFKEVTFSLQDLIQKNSPIFETNFEVNTINYPRRDFISILTNLLSNAIKYRSFERQSVISIAIGISNDNFFFISVADNGIDMQGDYKDKIFKMFKRMHNHVEGSGVGLYILKRIVESHGGRVEVFSEYNKGTKFIVYLKKINNEV